MNKIIFYTNFLSIVFIALSCNMNPNNISQAEKVLDTLTKQEIAKKTTLSLELLQGIWAENEKENALFFIKNDYLFYTEDQSHPIGIKLNNDTLIIMGDVTSHCKILKLTKDSLWFIDEFNNTPTKLYKRLKK